MFAFYVIFAVLVLVLYMLTRPLSLDERVHTRLLKRIRPLSLGERFVDMEMGMPAIDMSAVSEATKAITDAQAVSLEGMPTPPELFKKARELMAKYDQPDLWIHAARVMDKDPGQLARMNLGIE